MSNGFIYVVAAHFIDKIEETKIPGPMCLCMHALTPRKKTGSFSKLVFIIDHKRLCEHGIFKFIK